LPYCTSCGKEVQDGVNFCPHCGKPLQAQQPAPSRTVMPMDSEDLELHLIRQQAEKLSEAEKIMFYEQKKKSEAIGILLALFLLGGAGQIYAGKTLRGILCIIFSWLIIPWIYAIYDTYKSIRDYNTRLYMVILGSK